MKILILSEHNNSEFKENTFNTLKAAKKISNNIDLLIIGFNIKNLIEKAKKINFLSKILILDSLIFKNNMPENISNQILLIQKKYNYNYIMCTSSIYGKNILPRISGKLNIELISDIIKIKNPNIFNRLIYSGNIIETIEYNNIIKIISIRNTSFKKEKNIYSNQNNNKIIFFNEIINNFDKSNYISQKIFNFNKINLNTAKIIVSGGKGLKSKENFNNLIKKLAKKLNAGIGASRFAVDSGYISNDCQIGQSGKIVAPKIYIAIGISGAIQHLAGIKDSKLIIAINNDKDAPIFSIANYGIIGDLFKIVPEIIKQL